MSPPLTGLGGTTQSQGGLIQGSVIPGGAVHSQALAAALTIVGGTVKATARAIAVSLQPSAMISKATSIPIAGTVTTAGAVARAVAHGLAGSVTIVGLATRGIARTLATTITLTGGTVKATARAIAASTQPSGAISRTVGIALTASVPSVGAISRAIAKTLAATFAAVADLVIFHKQTGFTGLAVTGTILRGDRSPAAGATVTMLLSTALTNNGKEVVPRPLVAVCAADGTFTIAEATATDDKGTLPAGGYYTVTIHDPAEPNLLTFFNVSVPNADAPAVGLFALPRL